MTAEGDLVIELGETQLTEHLSHLAINPLPSAKRHAMIKRLWGVDATLEQVQQLEAYFIHLKATLAKLQPTDPVLGLTLEDALKMIDFLKRNVTMKYTDVLENCPRVEGVRCEDTIDLCLEIWLLVDPRKKDLQDVGSETDRPFWAADKSLQQAVCTEFPCQLPTTDAPRWPYILTAANLQHISGFTILWTSNLRNHLLFQENEKTVRIFHHATVLECLQNLDQRIEIFPRGFFWETQQSLAVLLPKFSTSSKKWYRNSKRNTEKKINLIIDDKVHDQRAMINGRKTQKFQRWGDRMSIIKDAFDQSEPGSFNQWWSDTRNSANRSAFWYALVGIFLAAFFGLCQTAVGVYQVILVYRAPQ